MRILRFILIFSFIISVLSCQKGIQEGWEPAPNALFTRWAKMVDPDNPHPEYPRPMMKREEWKNLNGLWDYSITPINQDVPDSRDGKILVPFPVESALSGVKSIVSKDSLLWYFRTFSIPESWRNKRILLHFEAVDWETKVWMNDMLVGSHKGGYDPFSFDITNYINDTEEQFIMISVYDPTSDGTQPRGKQVNDPHGIWYTPVTGIWQTVWIEPVPEESIVEIFTKTDIDNSQVAITVHSNQVNSQSKIEVKVLSESEEMTSVEGDVGIPINIAINEARLWSPDSPFLYDMQISLLNEGGVIDRVGSYFGMRKISLNIDEAGITRMFLNNEFVFQNGPLDQGFWPDGIYTAPTDEALKYDIEVTRELGFNMLRKHVKVESRRFYYWCDKLGILVWQDMPSGDKYIGGRDPDINRTIESASQFEEELKQLIKTKFNHPSIIVWVPFNEGWGQYNTGGVVDYIRDLDPTRLVNSVSGWADRGVGDILDIHNYPNPRMPEPQENRAIVLGEFGGLGLPIENHTWVVENWGYENMADKQALVSRYEAFYTQVYDFMQRGLSACVYTQITDVETETNGLLTYDREVIKLNIEDAFKINRNTYIPSPAIDPVGGWINRNDTVIFTQIKNDNIYYTTDGSDPDVNSKIYVDPIVLNDNTQIKARAFLNGEGSRIAEAEFTVVDIPRPDYFTKYVARYSAGGDFGLLDGERGSIDRRDGKWQGFQEIDVEITFNMGEIRNISEVTVGSLESTRSWIFPPKKITIEVSEDGNDFQKVGEIEVKIPGEYNEDVIRNHVIDFYATSAKFVRIHLSNIKECPEWHDGAGDKAWIFIDEVIMK